MYPPSRVADREAGRVFSFPNHRAHVLTYRAHPLSPARMHRVVPELTRGARPASRAKRVQFHARCTSDLTAAFPSNVCAAYRSNFKFGSTSKCMYPCQALGCTCARAFSFTGPPGRITFSLVMSCSAAHAPAPKPSSDPLQSLLVATSFKFQSLCGPLAFGMGGSRNGGHFCRLTSACSPTAILHTTTASATEATWAWAAPRFPRRRSRQQCTHSGLAAHRRRATTS